MDKPYVTHIVLRRYRSSLPYSELEAAMASDLGIGAIRYLRSVGLIEAEEVGGEHRYSEDTIIQLRRIRRMQHDLGINLAGVEVILRLLRRLEAMHQELEQEKKRNKRGKHKGDK